MKRLSIKRSSLFAAMLFIFCCSVVATQLSGANSCIAQSSPDRTASTSAGPSHPDEHPGNFIFLIDVSGSMLFKKTMVKAADGSEVTLFEALRQALKQIVSDDRLIGVNNKIAFVTFGTKINDKAEWPETLKNSDVRKDLLEKISNSEELQADKHGDTYMGGALDKAYERALQFANNSEPCATTFIIMLTDGWDEPPAGSTLKVRDVAQKIVDKQKEIKRRLGVNTWQVRVVGLQRLPDKKAGTTTAAEVANLLGGEFLDVSQQSSGTVADRIATAIRKTVAELQGKVELAPTTAGGVAAFGLMQPGADSDCSIKVGSRSCYGEKLLKVQEETGILTPAQLKDVRGRLQVAEKRDLLKNPVPIADCLLLSKIPAGAIAFHIKDGEVPLIPTPDQVGKGGEQWQPVELVAHVDHRCPPGHYIGAMRLVATARCDELVPFFISVPSRLVTDRDVIVAKVRKPGFLWVEPTKTELKFDVSAQVPSSQKLQEEITVEPGAGASEKGREQFDVSHINGGKSTVVHLNTAEPKPNSVNLAVDIPADQPPGVYKGIVKLRLASASKALAPADVHYTLDILPSPWEEVRHVAIPILALLGLFLILGTWLGLRQGDR